MSMGNESAVSIMDTSKVDLHLSGCCYKSFACAPFSITALQTKAALNNHQGISHFTIVYLIAKPLIWSEAKGDHVVIEISI